MINLELKEKQRLERPLPARMQAATHRVDKFATAELEATKALAGLEV